MWTIFCLAASCCVFSQSLCFRVAGPSLQNRKVEFSWQIFDVVELLPVAADEILELHSLMVFAGPASDRIFVLQIAKFVVLTGPAANEILPFCKAQ